MTRYLGTVLPGLERIAASEISAKLPGAEIAETSRGKLFFGPVVSEDAALALRSFDNLYLDLGAFEAGPHRTDLPALGRRAARLLEGMASLPLGERRTVWVNASRVGPQTYSRFEAAEAALAAILRHAPRWSSGTDREHQIELRLDVDGSAARLALRLTDATFRFRGRERAFSAGALRPTVAHALAWLTEPSETDVFVDPFCGSGTIAAERAFYPARRVIASDLSADALAAARKNVGERVELQVWNALALPLDSASVDVVATNLPFGRQVGDRAAMGALYRDFARELQRVLSPGGVAVALTELPDDLFAAVERTRLAAERVTEVSLKGLRASVLRVRPL